MHKSTARSARRVVAHSACMRTCVFEFSVTTADFFLERNPPSFQPNTQPGVAFSDLGLQFKFKTLIRRINFEILPFMGPLLHFGCHGWNSAAWFR